MDVSPGPQVIADQEAYSPGTRWCAVARYPAETGVVAVYGPYAAKQRAVNHSKALQEAGVHRELEWEILPLRLINLGRDAP